MGEQRPQSRAWGAANVAVALVSAAAYVGHGLIWVDNVWARVTARSSFSPVVGCYYCASLALSMLLLVAGLGLRDGHRWGRWASLLSCAGILLVQSGFCVLGVLFAPDSAEWVNPVVIGAVVAGSYALVLLVAFSLGSCTF
ncbi:MAG: hypothetical protein L0Z62_49245 [Gemmataceae bacterium]|nr:hypothetical protein [Gemmataceae bacterium]